ncbi:hypothetical protein M6D81_29025 [Paenibacillus sp. J5C_2022]|uniref:alpha-mannosidase n=1 Tax=Paenibacillus sp. J5C2022 TaxID=2977129 RepID=UPI0021CEE2CD|nr:alpha-mannosidase [Paenibacillus sp. J5C2022]MCU6712751.1 hypothetical protein [Paenibacillus sp. J5C2022]
MKKKLHMIGNAHIDPVWLWRWQEGFQEVKATFRSALDRMKEFEDFIFTCSSAAMFEWVEHNDPAMFQEIKERVAEGRWVIVGGWWVQPDCNIPGGESFVRQALVGQRYFKEKFGVTAKVGYNVDSFGHHGMLPQLLRGSGMDAYVFMRPMPHEKSLPGPLFQWESDDGSRVTAFRLMYEYGTWGKSLETKIRRISGHLNDPLNELMMFYGVGNHGGGPTIENLKNILELNGQPDIPELVFSSPNAYFEAIERNGMELPVVHDDLQHHASGCYAVHSGIKQWNRQAENKLILAEKLSSLAERATGQPYPDSFGRAWKNVLFNQFHDILAGTSIEEAYDDARNEYGEAMAIADRALNYAMQSVSWNIDIPQEEQMKPLVVFNPHAWSHPMLVEAEVGGLEEPVIVDPAGRELPLQASSPSSTTSGINKRYKLSFVDELPSMGYRVYRVYRKREHAVIARGADTGGKELKAHHHGMENSRYRLEFDPSTGYISGLWDKKLSVNLFKGEAARPVVIADDSDTWSHFVHRFDKEAGQFKAKSIRLLEHGPVSATIRVVSEYGSSKLVQDFTMYRELDVIHVRATVDWRERFSMLKLMFPVALSCYRPTYEIPYGHISREANGEEEPGQSWINYSGYIPRIDKPYGISILNDSKYSFSMHNEVIGFTVLRSPIYAHHEPKVPEPDGEYTFIDQGIQRFAYSLLPHEGEWESSETVRRAMELNQPPATVTETYHIGSLPQENSYIAVDRSNIVVIAWKKAEEGEAWILRCCETIKEACRAVIKLPKWNRTIEADFRPCEIKTFRIPYDEQLPVVETNMLEWEAVQPRD